MKAIIGIIIAVIVIGGGVFLVTRKDNKTTSGSSNTTSVNEPSSNNTSSTPTATSNISIKDFAFSPVSITVKKGTTVTWTNNDSASHKIASDSGDSVSFGSDNLSNGQAFSFKFDQAGTFAYHCATHPSMKGTITVTE